MDKILTDAFQASRLDPIAALDEAIALLDAQRERHADAIAALRTAKSALRELRDEIEAS